MHAIPTGPSVVGGGRMALTGLSTAEAARTLGPLLAVFDPPVTDLTRERLAILAMARRGIDIYRETLAVADRAPNVCLAGLRVLVDLAILVRWIEPCPKLRLAMWSADDDRDRLRGAVGHAALRRGRGVLPLPAFTEAQERRMRSRIERIRKIAIAHDERISRKHGDPVLPNTRARTEAAGDLAEAAIVFQVLSQPTHSSGRSYGSDRFIRRFDGLHYETHPAFGGSAITGLAVPSVCFLLASASRQLALGVDADLDTIRLRVARWTEAGGPAAEE